MKRQNIDYARHLLLDRQPYANMLALLDRDGGQVTLFEQCPVTRPIGPATFYAFGADGCPAPWLPEMRALVVARLKAIDDELTALGVDPE